MEITSSSFAMNQYPFSCNSARNKIHCTTNHQQKQLNEDHRCSHPSSTFTSCEIWLARGERRVEMPLVSIPLHNFTAYSTRFPAGTCKIGHALFLAIRAFVVLFVVQLVFGLENELFKMILQNPEHRQQGLITPSPRHGIEWIQ